MTTLYILMLSEKKKHEFKLKLARERLKIVLSKIEALKAQVPMLKDELKLREIQYKEMNQ